MDKIIGKKLDGRYEIVELIGVGGMAEVYKGIDVYDNKTVAIKILKKEYAENEEFLRRFRNESKAISVLSHPNIVKIYDIGFSEKIQYIVMEYIDGITLKEYIEEEKVLTWKDTVHFVIQILRALQHAHDKGIVHRDIKPQNIMMFTDGTIKVMDFGIAKFGREEGKTATDQAIGSVHYISPEQASGDVTDAKSDIYSVGAMMYEMLTGRKPFDSDNPVAIAVMHMHDIPERPRAINPDIPDGLEEIVLRAMEKAPEDRYQTTAEMISDIEAFKSDPTRTFGYYQEEDANEDTINFAAPSAGDVQSEMPGEAEGAYAPKAPAYAGAAAGAAAMYPNQQPPQRYAAQQPGYPNGYYEDEDDDDEEEERSSLVVPVLTAVVVVVIVVAVIFVALLLSDLLKGSGKKSDYTMPDFYNMDYNEAFSQYNNSIKFEVVDKQFNELEEGRIYEQSIDPGTEFNKGDTLKVKVSRGKEKVDVPPLKNVTSELAQDQLKQRGLLCEIKRKSDPDIDANKVIETDPPEGTEVAKGTKILVYVSMGASKGSIKVDNYVGKPIDDATYMADYAGLKVETKDKASYEPEGTVIEQSIEKGEMVEAGTEIILYFSNGKDPEGEIPITIKFPSDVSGRFVIDFIIYEDGNMGTLTTPNLILPTYSEYTQTITGSGESVRVRATLTNLSNNKNAQLGSYILNFAEKTIQTESEDVAGAFASVGGVAETTTEATEPVTTQNDTTSAPYLIGIDYNQAASLYGDVYLSVTNNIYSDYAAGTIIWQSIDAGTTIDKGTTINVTVSLGPEPTQETYPPTDDPGNDDNGEGNGGW